MSYVRVGVDSDVYVIGLSDGRIECCGCPQHPGRTTSFVGSANEVIIHLDQHREDGFKVPERAYRRLRADAIAHRLSQAGWVRKESKWQLPRALQLVRHARTDWVRGDYRRDKRACSEAWVPQWCARIAGLPCGIGKRREVLYTIATCSERRDAIEAAFEATPNVPDAVIFTIAEAEL